MRRGVWVELPPVLARAMEAALGPREDRELGGRLFPESRSTALRTATSRACKAAGVPEFSPRDLRHRRVSVLHLQGMPWARIGEHVGQSDLSTTANTYTHVLIDETEVDYGALLGLAPGANVTARGCQTTVGQETIATRETLRRFCVPGDPGGSR